MMMISLTDPSFTDDHDKLKCVLFNKDLHQFPAVLKVGDIVRFHRLQIIQFKNKPQGMIKVMLCHLLFVCIHVTQV